jgi:hypothetical protein
MRIISALKMFEFINDRMLYIILVLIGRWCDVIVPNVHAPTEDKVDDIKDSSYEKLECVFSKFPEHRMKILLGNFIAEVGRKSIFKPTIGNETLNEISYDNGIRVVNVVTSKNLTLRSTMLPHLDIHTFT